MTNTSGSLSLSTTSPATPATDPPPQHPLVRWAAPAGILAAVVGVPSDLYHFTIESRAAAAREFLFLAHGLGLTFALLLATVSLFGLALRAGPALGGAGRTFVSMAYVGTVLVIGGVANEATQMRLAPEALDQPNGFSLVAIIVSYALFAVGWGGVTVVLARRELITPGVTLLMCLGALYAFTPFPGSYVLLLLGIACATVSARRVQDAAAAARSFN